MQRSDFLGALPFLVPVVVTSDGPQWPPRTAIANGGNGKGIVHVRSKVMLRQDFKVSIEYRSLSGHDTLKSNKYAPLFFRRPAKDGNDNNDPALADVQLAIEYVAATTSPAVGAGSSDDDGNGAITTAEPSARILHMWVERRPYQIDVSQLDTVDNERVCLMPATPDYPAHLLLDYSVCRLRIFSPLEEVFGELLNAHTLLNDNTLPFMVLVPPLSVETSTSTSSPSSAEKSAHSSSTTEVMAQPLDNMTTTTTTTSSPSKKRVAKQGALSSPLRKQMAHPAKRTAAAAWQAVHDSISILQTVLLETPASPITTTAAAQELPAILKTLTHQARHAYVSNDDNNGALVATAANEPVEALRFFPALTRKASKLHDRTTAGAVSSASAPIVAAPSSLAAADAITAAQQWLEQQSCHIRQQHELLVLPRRA